MQKVNGIGGVFFRAKDPATLSARYQTHLGINPIPTDYDTAPGNRNPVQPYSRLSRKRLIISAIPNRHG